MLQKTFTNFRTLSFSIVMMAMLMVGVMTPVQQVAAQESATIERAAMLAQISQLTQLITQLLTQLQMMQGLETSMQDTTPEADTDDDLQNTIDDLMDQVVVSSQTPPGENVFSCDRGYASYGEGKLACYGMWDYGQAFGGDVHMCGSYSGGTGCTIKAPVCESGTAVATNYYSNRDLRGKSDNALRTIAGNLGVSTSIVQEDIAGLWEYECSDADKVTADSFDRNDYNFSRAIVVGAYEGTLPNGTTREFQEHPQGEVDVYLANDDYTGGILLVLNSYQPVKWNLTGPGVNNVVEKVLLTGYYDQAVTGISSSVPVTMKTHESGDREYFYAHDRNSTNYKELSEFINDEYDVNITQFHGSYKQDEVRIEGYKG